MEKTRMKRRKVIRDEEVEIERKKRGRRRRKGREESAVYLTIMKR